MKNLEEILKKDYILDSVSKCWVSPDSKDFNYSDGNDIENNILNIIKQANDLSSTSLEFRDYCVDWPSYYHLSPLRSNLLRPLKAYLKGRILEVGAGLGAVTRYLGEQGGDVLALEGSKLRAMAARERCRDLKNVTVIAESFHQFDAIKDFDVIILVGVLEYARKFFASEHGDPVDAMLRYARSLMRPGGILILAIENQLGLKYFAGFPEDHTGIPMYGVEDLYSDKTVVTFGQKELQERLGSAGFTEQNWWFPFPDYKLPVTVFSSRITEHNVDLSPLLANSVLADMQNPGDQVFSLERAWGAVFRNGLVPSLSNSFLVLASESSDAITKHKNNVLGYYFSLNRRPEFAKEIVFEIADNGKVEVKTKALFPSYIPNESIPLTIEFKQNEKFIIGNNWQNELFLILNSPDWSEKDIETWASVWYDAFLTYSGLVLDKENLSPQYIIPGNLFDSIPRNLIITENHESYFFDQEWRLKINIEFGYLLFRSIYLELLNITSVAKPVNGTPLNIFILFQTISQSLGFRVTGVDLARYAAFERDLLFWAAGSKSWLTPDELKNRLLLVRSPIADKVKQVTHLSQTVQLLQTSLIEKEQMIQEISREKEQQLHEKEQQLHEKEQQLHEKEQQLHEKEQQLHEITLSKVWRVAISLRRMRMLILPPGSRGVRLLKKLIAVLILPVTIWKNFRIRKNAVLLYSSDLFDETWYLEHNSDVTSTRGNPARHYLLFGGFEGRDPGPHFSSQSYRNDYPDIVNSRINPLIHYLKFGMTEGRVVRHSAALQRPNASLFGTEEVVDQGEMTLPIRKISKISHRSTSVSIVIPTKNAGNLFKETLDAIKKQQYEGPVELVIIDSGSTDNTLSLASEYGAVIVSIPPKEFDHGLTRNRAIEEASGEIIILMSQDVLPGNEHLIHNFVTAFEDPNVAGAYARQMPRENADVITKRNLNNWLTGRKKEEIRSITDWASYQNLSPMERYFFCNFDDVCSAVRKSVWQSIPFNANNFGEDIDWSQRVLESGWKIAYWPSSYVIHSHERSYRYEYDRTCLCHEKLYSQFGIHTVPTWRDVFRSTMASTLQDWSYVFWHEKQSLKLLLLLARIPFLSFASVYGQYKGANTGNRKLVHTNKVFDEKKMRIILTVHQFVPDFSSGTEILTFETAKELKKQGHDVSVFTGFPAQGETKKERFDQYTYEGINVTRFYHNYLPNDEQSNPMEMEYDNRLFASYFRNYLKREKPDVVHFFHLMRLSASAVDVCYDLGVPTVLTPTDFWFICPTCQLRLPDNRNCSGPDISGVNCLRHVVYNNQSEKIKAGVQKIPDWALASLIYFIKKGISFDKRYSPLVRAFSKRREFLQEKINRINKVIIPTQVMMSTLTQNGLEQQRTIPIPFGLNLSYIQNAKRSEPVGVLRLGYIGTLSEHKGVHILVQAVRQLENKPIDLKIYGKLEDFPEYVEDLRKIIGDDSRIKFCGTFPNREIGRIFSDLDALVVPSLWHENSPLVIYSAQFAKCPVIASDMEGMSEIIEHGKNGLLFEVGNVDELTQNIEAILNNMDLLQDMSNNAKDPLSIQEYTSRLIQIYADIIQEERIL